MASTLRCLLVVFALGAVCCANRGKFTSMSNLEKLFYIESEVIALSDVFLREEHFAHQGEDPHNLGGMKKTVEKNKVIHRNISNMSEYLSHPINVFHLTRRLCREWKSTLQIIWTGEPCQKWNIPQLKARLANINNNMPTRDDLMRVALGIAHIQYTENMTFDDIYAGVIRGRKSLQPVIIEDLIDLAWGAFSGGQFLFTTNVVERVLKECKKNPGSEYCNSPKAFKIAASSYYEMNKLEEAVQMIDKVLSMDPEDKGALRSRRFYAGRLRSKSRGKEVLFGARNVKYYETCRGERRKSSAQMSRLHCVLLPTRYFLVFEKAEYHHMDPPIVEFHSTIQPQFLKVMKRIATKAYREMATRNLYQSPDFTFRPLPTYAYKQYASRFMHLKSPLTWPFVEGSVEIRQISLEGMYFRPKDRENLPNLGSHVGSFFTFLDDEYNGGEFVFPKYKLKITPNIGNTIFFFPTRSTLNICPVSYGVQWLAVQSLFEKKVKGLCRLYDQNMWDKDGKWKLAY
ncbi:prolyl 4-hydroxylase subunit alpha-2-like [Haliotis rufescens]|uniref:prolyl 4-hydroxylase subunit alpha-2-like n=1 Tax=Haliotis rufescens TaxID=6454 RepID=UPI00201F5C10|nr:prolyl 4-hydroxylase subunit alpha-2-like [Haliotis rufescens]